MSKQWRFCVKLVREILFLKFTTGKSDREIADVHSVSKNTVNTYVFRAQVEGIINVENLFAISDESLKEIIFPYPIKPPKAINIDFDFIHKELTRLVL